MRFRERLALAHEVSVSLVRKWESDPPLDDWDDDKRRKLVRRHPADLESIRITERLTENQVRRADLRPECWPLPEMEEAH